MKHSLAMAVAGMVWTALAWPAAARATLQSWRYDPRQQSLVFRTDQPTQPQVQVVGGQRVVIDLPDTHWPHP
ncbi:MAG: AMIN domain-containing protein, partial [Gloeomargarita sp. DG_2_bins_126]